MQSLLINYFTPRLGEERVYKLLAVRVVSSVMLGGKYYNRLARWLSGRNQSPVRGKATARRYISSTMWYEGIHLVAFGIMLILFTRDIIGQDISQAALNAALNGCVNVYPILVQRYNRVRLLRLFDVTLAEFWADAYREKKSTNTDRGN